MFTISKLNSISPKINNILKDGFNLTQEDNNPDAIILRSFKMHDYNVGGNLLAVARAGAGVNNIPISKMTEKGIVVFNTPGANANAVKELVIGAMIIASRNIKQAMLWADTLKGEQDVPKLVESGKGAFVGPELYGKKVGVIGLGAIGAMVANACVNLGMDVYGYDPYISVDAAWSLSHKIHHEVDLDNLFSLCDYITLHIPLVDDTKEIINADTISKMKNNVIIINCARGELVCNQDIIKAVNDKRVGTYVTDFPNGELVGVDNIIAIPHLGASSPEAEDNCAKMAATQLKDYLLNGNIVNSVNYPTVYCSRKGKERITIAHKNISSMISQATSIISAQGINIANIISSYKGEVGYMIIDIDTELTETMKSKILSTEGFLKVRFL